MEELEDALTVSEDARLRMDVTMQAMRKEHERALSTKTDEEDESRRSLSNRIRDLESEIENERRAMVFNSIKKIEFWAQNSVGNRILTIFDEKMAFFSEKLLTPPLTRNPKNMSGRYFLRFGSMFFGFLVKNYAQGVIFWGKIFNF